MVILEIRIDLANNKLKKIKGLKDLKYLKKLDLGANRIRVLEPDEIGGLESLEELWMGKNKIEQIQGLENVSYTDALTNSETHHYFFIILLTPCVLCVCVCLCAI